jgi:N6-adenosine-specific RNA methylase IME4
VEQLISYGFLFIWVEKELLAQVVRVAMRWGFKYVENFCWIKKTPDNRIVKQISAHFACSKATLLIFRKVGKQLFI